MPVSDYGDLYQSAGRQYNVDPRLIRAVITTESAGNPNVVSSAGAQGVAQLMPATAKSLGVTDSFDPKQAIPAAAKLLSDGIDRYGNVQDAVRSYHGGTNTAQWGPKTQAYLTKVTQNYQAGGAQMADPIAHPVDSMSDDALISSFSHAPAAPVANAAPVDHLSDDDLIKTFAPPSPSTAAKAAAAQPANATLPQGMTPEQAIENYGSIEAAHVAAQREKSAQAGIVQGLEDIPRGLIKTANYVFPKLGMGEPVELPFEAETQNRLAQNQDQPDFGRGRFLGTAIATAPLAAAGGSAISAGAGALGRAVPALAPVGDFIAGASEGSGLAGKALQYGSRAVNGALQGAAATPLLAATSDASLPDQFERNALFGATVGAGTAAAADILGGAGRFARNLLGAQDSGEQANSLLLRAMNRDNVTPADLTARAAAFGDKPVSVMDLGGDNMQRLGRTVNTVPGQGSNDLAAALASRGEEQHGRVLKDITKNLAPDQAFFQTADDLAAQAKKAAAPLYDKAYSKDFVYNEGIDNLMNRPSMKSALTRAYGIAAEEGRNPQGLGLGLNDAGDVELTSRPSMQTMDYVKRGLDDVLEPYRNSITGKLDLDEAGRAINQTRSDFVSQLKRANPDYTDALQAYGGPMQTKDALFMGKSTFNTDPELVAKQFGRLSPSDQQFYQLGAAKALRDRIDGAGDNADAVRRIFGNQRIRDQISAVFGPDATAAFETAMNSEKAMLRTNRTVLGGSQTANKLADLADSGNPVAQDILHGALHGAPGGPSSALAGGALNAVMGLGRRSINRAFMGLNEPTANELGSILSQTGKDNVASIAKRLGDSVNQGPGPGLSSYLGRTNRLIPLLIPRDNSSGGTSASAR